MNHSDIKTIARNVIKIESETVNQLSDRIDDNFVEAVIKLFSCRGRVIVIGIGKSGHIGQKISSTMASTGTPSYFVHPGEAIHGDLGMITKEDIVLMISNSGETIELVQILPSIKQKNVPIIAITGRKKSILSKEADIALDASVEKEACTLDLAPTASTTAALALGDALAIALLEYRGFESDDFARNHPGGTLGKRLVLKLHNLVHTGDQVPFVNTHTNIKDCLLKISNKGLGVTGVLNNNESLVGVITDGDIRRALSATGNEIFDQTAEQIMSKEPKSISIDTLAISALEYMEKLDITSLFVYSEKNQKKPDGIIHIHDLLKAGI
tara:strand:- start:798 stop:1775 length:978 start_codon:yes stop_codon:yes gene_type:complete